MKRTIAVLTVATSTVGATISASASASVDTVTTAEVVAALGTTKGQLASPAANPQVNVPTDPKEGVTLNGVTMHLPNASEAGEGVAVAGGVTAYSGQNSANAVVTSASGAQFLTVIGNNDAPNSYTYTANGGSFRSIVGGGAALIREDGTPVAVFPAPWAYDATGKRVATRFVTDGNTLTQIVEHNTPGVTYPVVADPWISFFGGPAIWIWSWMLGNWLFDLAGYWIGCGSLITAPCRVR